ncbi:hybrid sensor histidine kinase/response regulator [Noviherbaspirillum aridicola]|uniref:histidine kinase n=1 Tax=Noviherbaspirillum aridicola TaxID=2849687 RepID=A0ABQ4QA36_9BURK|nr:ATP-binding protein [Noviherbaspirillum aridicola]GIZ53927.1 hypothetical protein NCCP691_39410 [Noviherbaspirillum aridicola]
MLPAALYATVFKNSPIGCYLLSTTPEITILDVNDSFLHNVSLTRECMIGKPLFEVFPDNPDDAEDTGIEALRASIRRAVATGQPQVMPVQRFPIQKTLPDGGVVFEERFWSASNTPIFDEAGEMVCIFHATVEITRQVQAEAALRDSERKAVGAARLAEAERLRLNAVLDAAPVGIGVADAGGAILLVNQEYRRIWGEALPWPERIDDYGKWPGWWADPPERRGRALQPQEWPLARALTGEEAPRDVIEIATFDPAAGRRTVFISAAPIRSGDGSIEGAVVAVLDITARVRAEEALKDANRRKDEFLAMLAHELRNPLAPISAAADLLSLGRLDAEGVQRTSAVISRQVQHMTGLVEDLLDVSRVTRGLVTLHKDRLDLKRIVADAVEQVRPLIEARDHSLTVHVPPEPAFVSGDQKRLIQVLTNLLTNAARYTPPGGTIWLNLDAEGDFVRVSVADNGIGMQPDLLARAFDLFAQAERTADRSQGGLGIGLALVRSLVEMHGGHVTARSDGLGKGSRFVVCLPRAAHAGASVTSDASDRAIPDTDAAGRLKVMVVDDNEDAAEMLAMLVEALGHRVFVEHGSVRALQRAQAIRPDVFLLDIGLPDLDGNELARRLRSRPETARALLIAVTGYGQEQDRKAVLEAGFDHHFVKPVDTAKIADLLSAAAGSGPPDDRENRTAPVGSMDAVQRTTSGRNGQARR